MAPEYRRINTKRSRTPPLVILLSVAVFLLAGINLIAAGYMYGALLEVRKFDARLQKQELMEDRLKAQIDQFSVTVKNEIEASGNALLEQIQVIGKNAPPSVNSLIVEKLGVGTPGIGFEPRNNAQQPALKNITRASPNRKTVRRQKISIPKNSKPPKYRRVEDANGQVRFIKQ